MTPTQAEIEAVAMALWEHHRQQNIEDEDGDPRFVVATWDQLPPIMEGDFETGKSVQATYRQMARFAVAAIRQHDAARGMVLVPIHGEGGLPAWTKAETEAALSAYTAAHHGKGRGHTESMFAAINAWVKHYKAMLSAAEKPE